MVSAGIQVGILLLADTTEDATGFWAYLLALLPAIALTVTPIAGFFVARKESQVRQHENLVEDMRDERNEMRKDRDDTDDKLKAAEAKLRELEEAVVQTRIKNLQLEAKLADNQEKN